MVWEKVIRELFREGKTLESVGGVLHIPQSEVDSLLFGIMGSGAKPQGNPKLEIVEFSDDDDSGSDSSTKVIA